MQYDRWCKITIKSDMSYGECVVHCVSQVHNWWKLLFSSLNVCFISRCLVIIVIFIQIKTMSDNTFKLKPHTHPTQITHSTWLQESTLAYWFKIDTFISFINATVFQECYRNIKMIWYLIWLQHSLIQWFHKHQISLLEASV